MIPKGIGTDIIEISRIEEALEKHERRFLDRLFTQREQEYCQKHKNPLPNYAGRFAAKEAILKALGTGLVGEMSWHEIEVINNKEGKPEVFFSDRLQALYPNMEILLSISHCKSYATATALLIG